MSDKVEIQLTKNDALALLELLARYIYDGQHLTVAGPAEESALRVLCESLDDELVE